MLLPQTRFLLLIPAAILAVAGFLPLPAVAAESAAATDIEVLRAELATSDLTEPEKQSATSLLDTARSERRLAETLTGELDDLKRKNAMVPERTSLLRQSLSVNREQALAEWAGRLPAEADTETLERLLQLERSTVEELSAEVDVITSELVDILSRPAQTSTQLGQLRRRAEELTTATPATSTESPLLLAASNLRREAELRRVTTEITLRELERDSALERQRLLELTLSELRSRQELHVQRAELLLTRIEEQARSELAGVISRITESAGVLAAGEGVTALAAAENLALGEELSRQNTALVRDRQAAVERERDRLEVARALRESRTRLELAGTSEAVGRWLWQERRSLAAPARLNQQRARLRNDLADLRLRRVMVTEQRRPLDDVPAVARDLHEKHRTQVDEGEVAPDLDPALVPLLYERIELLNLLDPLLQRRAAALEQMDRALTEQIDNTQALRHLLDRHLLWSPSHARMDFSWLQRVPEGIYDLIKPSRLQTTLKLSWEAVQNRPLPWFSSLLLLLVLVELRRRAPRGIEAQATVTRQVRRDSYQPTARAFGWTLLAALPGPVALLLIGSLLQSVGNPGRYSDSLGRACLAVVMPLFAVQLLRWTVIERGLAHAHFRWLKVRRRALRKVLPIAAAIILPMYFVSALAFIRNLDLPNDVQARMAILFACSTLAWAIWRLLAPDRLWAVRGVEVEPSTLRRLLRVLVPAAIVSVAGLAVIGYVYTAGILTSALLSTFTLIVAITLFTGLLGRWFLLGERRLAWSRLEERRAAAAQAAGEGVDVTAASTAEAEGDVSIEQINAQTRRLLRALRLTLVATGLILVWSEVLPAITRLEDIALWHFADVDADGLAVQQAVTLMDALFGAFALALTLVGARNLPGLIEVGMQSYTRIDAASRYAITSVLRYAIVITGVVIGLGLLGMRWSQLQWLAAALTVGLGFGLQEIFANFVSGLILLFERPFRVGDIITVGDLSGRVTKIRTRATTILDFDNKEIVVPNKNFITGQLVNWTLSDATTRITIKVGVAYGTQPARVHALLQQVARENTQVLQEPEPQSWFMAFGASSLDFELRVFVATIADRLKTQDEINTRITELFAENGIEIAFPQLDLHVRDLPVDRAT